MFSILTILTGNNSERNRNFRIWYDYYVNIIGAKDIYVVSQNDHPDLSNYKNIKSVRFETKNKLFNRSLCINKGIYKSKNEKCVFVDSDILIPKDNFKLFLNSLNKFNFAVPYNHCMNLSEKETVNINLKNLKGGKQRTGKNVSKGGALFCNKSAFLKIKGYYPGFWGWGGEDDAFFHIAKTLDSVYRPNADYKIYHLNHKTIGRRGNPVYNNNRDLWIKISRMNKAQLKKFLKI